MKVLFINSIFPNSIEPTKGNFVLKNIAAYPEDIQVAVIAPVPFFLGVRRGKATVRVNQQDTLSLGTRQIKVYRPRIILLPRNLLQPLMPILEYLFIRRICKQIAKEWSPDIIHANFGTPDGIAAALISKETSIPLVITEHQAKLRNFLNIPIIGKMMLWAYDKAYKVICVSSFSANIIKEFKPTLPNLTVIPNGVDFRRFRLRQLSQAPRKAIYIGYLVPHKGVHVLLKALAKVQESGISLDLSIVGDGSYRQALELLSRQLNISSRVSFLGEKSAAEVAELISKHDFMIHPSFIESFGIVMVEALAAGLPVLGTFNGGAEDIVSSEVGTLVKVNDVDDLVSGITSILSRWKEFDPEAIRSYALSRFSMENVAKRTIEVYKECLDAKR